MAKKKELDSELKELRANVQAGKVIVGKERVVKRLKTNKLQKIFIANNCPPKIKDDVERYAKLTETPVVELSMDNEEFGVFCKKNFFISVLGVTEE